MEGGGRRETAHAGRKLAVTLGEEARKSGGETRSAGDEGAREEAGSLSAVAGGDERKRRESEREQRARLTLLFLLRHLAHAEMALATRCEPATSAGGWMTNASMKKRGSKGGGEGSRVSGDARGIGGGRWRRRTASGGGQAHRMTWTGGLADWGAAPEES